MWIYIRNDQERGLWTVGVWGDGKWYTDSDHTDREEAARRCNYLNGGTGAYMPREADHRTTAHHPQSHDARALAVKAAVDPRTLAKYLKGEPVRSTCAERIRQALALEV
jgi:hypothetical protein